MADELLTINELARMLKVPVGTIHQWNYRRTGPVGFMVGRSLRWRKGEVEAWIDAQAATAQRRRTA